MYAESHSPTFACQRFCSLTSIWPTLRWPRVRRQVWTTACPTSYRRARVRSRRYRRRKAIPRVSASSESARRGGLRENRPQPSICEHATAALFAIDPHIAAPPCRDHVVVFVAPALSTVRIAAVSFIAPPEHSGQQRRHLTLTAHVAHHETVPVCSSLVILPTFRKSRRFCICVCP